MDIDKNLINYWAMLFESVEDFEDDLDQARTSKRKNNYQTWDQLYNKLNSTFDLDRKSILQIKNLMLASYLLGKYREDGSQVEKTIEAFSRDEKDIEKILKLFSWEMQDDDNGDLFRRNPENFNDDVYESEGTIKVKRVSNGKSKD